MKALKSQFIQKKINNIPAVIKDDADETIVFP